MYYARKTGYLYHLTDTEKPLVKSMLHWITWTVEGDTTVWRLNAIDCDCQRQIVAEVRNVSVVSIADFGYGFFASPDACEGRCEDEIAILVAQAINNGWTILGGGVLVQKTSENYSCYRFDYSPIAVVLCIDTGSSYKYIGCDCSPGEIISNYSLYGYLEYSACECLDIRELILTYPEAFGVEDVSFGDDTVYTKEYTSTNYEWDENTNELVTTVVNRITTSSCLDHSNSYNTWFCDYRHMYVIFDNECVGMPRPDSYGYGNYTPHMMLVKFDSEGDWMGGGYPLKYDYVPDGTMYFDGKMPPFTSSEEALVIWPHAYDGMNWKGLTIRWIAINSNNYWGGASDSYYNKSDAEAELNRLNNLPNKYGYNSFEAVTTDGRYFYEPKTSVTPPDFNPTHVEGRIEYNQDTDMWDVYAPHDEFGNDDIVYNLNFAETNKGFLINGLDGYFDTLDVYGFLDSLTHWTSPPTEASVIEDYQLLLTRCYDSEQGMESMCPEGSEKIVGRNGAFEAIMSIPMYDMSFIIIPDESMGGCQSKEWWDAIIGQYEDESESESESISEDEP